MPGANVFASGVDVTTRPFVETPGATLVAGVRPVQAVRTLLGNRPSLTLPPPLRTRPPGLFVSSRPPELVTPPPARFEFKPVRPPLVTSGQPKPAPDYTWAPSVDYSPSYVQPTRHTPAISRPPSNPSVTLRPQRTPRTGVADRPLPGDRSGLSRDRPLPGDRSGLSRDRPLPGDRSGVADRPLPGIADSTVETRPSGLSVVRIGGQTSAGGVTLPVSVPTPQPVAAPAPIATPGPAPAPIIAPGPAPAPIVAPGPAPVPIATPGPAPAPVPIATPGPAPAPVPIATPGPAPAPAPITAPGPAPAPVPIATPGPAPAPAPITAPGPAPAPFPAPAPIPVPPPQRARRSQPPPPAPPLPPIQSVPAPPPLPGPTPIPRGPATRPQQQARPRPPDAAAPPADATEPAPRPPGTYPRAIAHNEQIEATYDPDTNQYSARLIEASEPVVTRWDDTPPAATERGVGNWEVTPSNQGVTVSPSGRVTIPDSMKRQLRNRAIESGQAEAMTVSHSYTHDIDAESTEVSLTGGRTGSRTRQPATGRSKPARDYQKIMNAINDRQSRARTNKRRRGRRRRNDVNSGPTALPTVVVVQDPNQHLRKSGL